MKIAVLTSSRADYGIYLPLLKVLKQDPYFDLKIIAFGTHLSYFHGHTIDEILTDGFEVNYSIETVQASDTANSIATSMAVTSIKFAEFWNQHQSDFELVFCLGDRYEMFSAVMAAVPYQIKFAHLHGGEETLGAIDNVFRHSITLACKYHFVSCELHAQRVFELTHSSENVYNIGSLSLDSIKSIELYNIDDFQEKFSVNLKQPTILVTVHPETVTAQENSLYVEETAQALLALKNYQVLITLPNSDTNGLVIRNRFLQLTGESNNRIICHENLGIRGYFTAMKYCTFLLGNTSSGIIEAASYGKWVINLGNRQKGRQHSQNLISITFEKEIIISTIHEIENYPEYTGTNIYDKRDAAETICSILKKTA